MVSEMSFNRDNSMCKNKKLKRRHGKYIPDIGIY